MSQSTVCLGLITPLSILPASCQVIYQVQVMYNVIVCVIAVETSHNKLLFCLKITKDSGNSMLRLYICQRLAPLINVYLIPAEDQIAWCLVLGAWCLVLGAVCVQQQTVIVVGYALYSYKSIKDILDTIIAVCAVYMMI